LFGLIPIQAHVTREYARYLLDFAGFLGGRSPGAVGKLKLSKLIAIETPPDMPRSSTQKINLAERRQRAVNLRKQGATYRAIAKRLAIEFEAESYSESQAFKDVDACLRELNKKQTHDTEEYRRLELERLDEWQARLLPAIQDGDIAAIKVAVQLSDRRCKLLGLDAPLQVKVEELVESELQGFIESLRPVLSPETFREVLHALAAVGDRSAVAGRN